MSTKEFQSLKKVILTAGQDLLDRSRTGSVFLPLDETNYVAVGTLAGILHVAGKEFPAESSTAGAAKGQMSRVDAFMAKWDDDGATRGSAFIELRDLARELEAEVSGRCRAQGGITSLEGLTRYDICRSNDDGDAFMEEWLSGDYVRFSDVERLLASTAVEQKERGNLDPNQVQTIADRIRNTSGLAAPASPEHVQVELSDRDTLAFAIARAAERRGIIGANTTLTGPQLIMLCDALAAPSAAAPAAPTDISQRLREYSGNPGYSHNDYADTMLAAAEEIERYYGGMMAWKRTAEKKDRDWNAERMARVDERCAARAMAPAAPEQVQTDAARDVLAERRRQIEEEGWTTACDDEHAQGQMARAAACYALHDRISVNGWEAWPWAPEWWKPDFGRRDIVKAGALILAEIERIDRSMKRQAISELNGGDA
jgi:hypothetical protein